MHLCRVGSVHENAPRRGRSREARYLQSRSPTQLKYLGDQKYGQCKNNIWMGGELAGREKNPTTAISNDLATYPDPR